MGLELGETRDPHRTAGRVGLERFRSLVFERLDERIDGLAFLVSFRAPLASRQALPKGPAAVKLADALADAILRCSAGTRAAILPPPLRAASCFAYSQHGATPQFVFDAELDPIVPEIAADLTRRLTSAKVCIDRSSGIQMLLLWSESSAFRALFDVLAIQTLQVLHDRESVPYDHVALFDCRLPGTERALVIHVSPSHRRQ